METAAGVGGAAPEYQRNWLHCRAGRTEPKTLAAGRQRDRWEAVETAEHAGPAPAHHAKRVTDRNSVRAPFLVSSIDVAQDTQVPDHEAARHDQQRRARDARTPEQRHAGRDRD